MLIRSLGSLILSHHKGQEALFRLIDYLLINSSGASDDPVVDPLMVTSWLHPRLLEVSLSKLPTRSLT